MKLLPPLALLLAPVLGACTSYSSFRFVPPVQDQELRGDANDLQARVTVSSRGIEERDGVPTIRFRVRVENPGPAAFTLVPADFELLDAALVSLGQADSDELPPLLEPGQAATFDLSFPIRSEKGLRAFDLTTLTLGSKLQGGRWSWSTVFQQAEPFHDHAPFSFSFGAGWVVH